MIFARNCRAPPGAVAPPRPMNNPVRPAALLPGDTPSRWHVWRAWLLRTFPGRALLFGLAIKLVTWPLGFAMPLPAAVEAVDIAGSLALLFAGAYGLTRLAMWAKRRLLWRVRRKLILSYVFVGVVPALLVITFFLLAGLILLFNVSSYLVQSRVRSLTDQARFLAQTAQLEVQRSATAANVAEALERRQSSTETRYPYLSLAIIPASGLTCPAEGQRAARVPRTLPAQLPISAGAWSHLDVPAALPKWVTCDGFAGIVAFEVPPDGVGGESGTRLVMRAVALPEVANPAWAVVLDMPLSTTIEQRITEETGIRLGEVTAFLGEGRRPPLGRAFERRPPDPENTPFFSLATQRWVTFLDFSDWTTGEPESASVAILINVWEIYNRISVVSQAGVGAMNFGQLLLLVLAVIGTLFLIIQFVALVIGFVLARQITGAVHDLFTGTQHVRSGDFAHQIPVRARDQLGELAESFNLMTGEVTTLLGEMAEKGRMEQEMFAARAIQQKLLPSGPLRVTGLAMSAFCEPAREVAGDYYDFLPITDTMTGVLIADVAGKGLAAGLYMAQLKVIVQSLARLHHEPKEFLSAVNRVVSANLDAASFITMTYGVIDVERREMTFARAGHCPLIHVPADQPPGRRKARLLVPDGLVVGLQIDDGTLFDGLLQEQTISLAPGDLVVWFTDGISETMNEAFDCFGEERLAQVVEQYAHLPFDQLRSYILAELRAFASGADQHDDMTMILMKMDLPAPVPIGSGTVA
ncbi:MAG: SpoIIE family protein phosphatase [Acidobacteriota bacterium]|nr:SpoIIE family protein phosphatase [Acidobacteriota bacterium]